MSTQPPPPPVVDGVTLVAHAPEGWVVDLENPTRTSVMEHYLIFGIMGTFAFIALCQRYYTKIFLSKGLTIDDFFMFLAWLTSVATQALMCYQVANKTLGIHMWEMVRSTYLRTRPVTYATAGIFMMCNGFTKVSLLTFYLQLSPQKGWKIAIWSCIGVVALASTIITTMLYLHCTPPQKAYTPDMEGTCLNPATLYIATAASNIITDVMLFVLPIPMIVQLRMSKAQKIGAVIIFGIGSVTVATSGVRLFYLMKVLKTTDLGWDAAQANVWSLIEANLFIICGSMPTLRKFFKHFAPKLMGGSSNNTSAGRYVHYGGSHGNSVGIQTIGGTGKDSRRARSQYMEMRDLSPTSKAQVTTDEASDKAQPDNGSEKAILQTKTVEVHYS